MKRTLLLVTMIFLCSVSLALADGSPVGKWKTIDDKTKKEKSIVEIYEANGKIYGKIVQLLQEKDGGASKLCTKCPGTDQNKPMIGLVIVRGLAVDGNEYTGGTIMDPNDGKVYKCKMEVTEGGNKMNVRGFIGFSLLGRTQVWHKVK